MKFVCTPSWVATIALCAVIVITLVRIPFIHPSADSVAFLSGTHVIDGDVLESRTGESSAQITIGNLTIDSAPREDRVLVTAPRDMLPNIGDRVSVTCALERPAPFDGFAYDQYLAIRDVYAVCRTNDILFVTEPGSDRRVATALTRIRHALLGEIARVLPEPSATLLGGLLVGDAQFSDVWRARFLATGTSHIVAASGFNVSVVALVCVAFLTFFGVRRQHAFWIVASMIVVYVVLAGCSPAVVRAGVMGGLVLLARKIGRKTTLRNIVLLAVATMLVIEPRLALYDVGFQLSVISTVALIWVAPGIAARLTWVPTALDMREIFSSTLAATLCTLPLVVLAFGSVSVIGPLVNLLVLPCIPYAMGLGVAALIATPFSAAVSRFVFLPAWGLLSAMLGIIRLTASIPLLIVIPLGIRAMLAGVLTALIALFLWRSGLLRARSSRASSHS